MIEVNIALLKSKLSYYLRQVKQGYEVLVIDRKTPVATLSPSSSSKALVISPAKKSPAGLKDLKIRPTKKRFDPLDVLLADRARR